MDVEEQYGDQVAIIGVPGLSNVDAMREFVEETGTGDFVHLPDPDGVIWNEFGVRQQRTYVLINDDGSFEQTGYGSLEQDVLDLIAR